VHGTVGWDFSLAEGCWNWLAVRQELGTGGTAKNEVWLNGTKVVTAPGQQNAGAGTSVTDVRFGYATGDAVQDGPLTYYVDDASVGVANASLATPAAHVCGQAAPPSERPNVLVFMTDDQPAGTEESRPDPGSPYLMQETRDRFVTGGEVYEEAFATTPQCCPSRASIFTGRYAHNHAVTQNRLAVNLGLTENSAGQKTTLQHYLKTRLNPAYKTAIFGKYLNAWPLSRKPPWFDDWAVFNNFELDDPSTPEDETQPHLSRSTITPDVCETRGSANFEASEACVAERAPDGTNVMKPMPSGVYETDFLAQEVASFLADAEDAPEEDETPWLMYVTPTVPHSPFTPKAESPDYRNLPISSFADDVPAASLEADRQDKPRYVRDNPVAVDAAGAESAHDAQLRMIKSADDLVQDVFAELDSRGETGTTLAFFVSDNGYVWGQHGMLGKHMPYHGSARIPFMVRWPGHGAQVSPGGRDQRLVANIDIAPTVMSVLGLSPEGQNPPMDGRSLFDPAARARLLLEAWVKDPLPGGVRPLCEEQGYCRPESDPPTPPGELVPLVDPPTFATSITPSTQGYHYTRYYLFDPATDPPLENRVIFREFYSNSDVFQLDNLFGGDGTPGGDDLGPTPPDGILGSQLERDRRCRGHPAPGSWPPPCP
jgi:arylsulfatase A-like enzyme